MFLFRKFSSCSVLLTMVLSLPTLAVTPEQEAVKSQLQCPIPTFLPIVTDTAPVTDDSIHITSKYSSIEKDQVANFSGDVTLSDNNQTITADQLTFNRLLMRFNAQGNIHYQNLSY